MKRLTLAMAMFIAASSAVLAGDAYIVFAKSLTAKQYDKNLPAVPIVQWLGSVLPGDVEAVWGKTVTDCGEQVGDPETDRGRDMPLCAEIELKKKGEVIGHLLLFVGTGRKGKMKDDAGLYYGYYKLGIRTVDVKELGEIANMKDRMLEN